MSLLKCSPTLVLVLDTGWKFDAAGYNLDVNMSQRNYCTAKLTQPAPGYHVVLLPFTEKTLQTWIKPYYNIKVEMYNSEEVCNSDALQIIRIGL